MWMTTPFRLPVLLLIAALVATGAAQSNVDDDTGNNGASCRRICGGVDIPYPFGIGAGCFRDGFEIICDDQASGGGAVRPRLLTTRDSAFLMPVVHLSVAPRLEATVMLPASSQCYDSAGNIASYNLNGVFFDGRAFRISSARNELYILGCNTLAYTRNYRIHNGTGRFRYTNYAGCMAFSRSLSSARDGACESVGCCHVQIPAGRTDNAIAFVSDSDDNGTWSQHDRQFCPCDYAFIVERGEYTFQVSDLRSMPHNKTMPVVLDGAIRYDLRDRQTVVSCAQAKNKTGYACRGDHTECFDSDNGPGYICSCTKGYEGNPYKGKNGECINIDECSRPVEFPCHGICKDTEGSYECKCPPGHFGDPTTKPCTPTLPRSAKIGIGIGVGIFLSIVILLGTWLVFKQKELEQAIERKNGSERLKNVKTLILYTPDQLYKITKNNSIPLGRGGFGQVYKGILEDNTEVAVKASIRVNEDTVNEFVREVEIQSRMMHRNILKLLGCCLRVDVPLLVYEYAAKGTLQDILHGKQTDGQREPLPLDSRLDIAIGSAQGLAYMHSFTENGIQHADVKPSNILVDAGFVPKISDFGLSKMFNAGKDYTMDVRGHLDYMDPSSIHKRRLTKKGDVYSFGIVLLELICRKPVVYDGLHLLVEYMKVYEQDRSGRVMFDKDIAKEEDILILEEIGMLAMKCLKENDEERPAMVSVASALVMLKDSWGEKRN